VLEGVASPMRSLPTIKWVGGELLKVMVLILNKEAGIT